MKYGLKIKKIDEDAKFLLSDSLIFDKISFKEKDEYNIIIFSSDAPYSIQKWNTYFEEQTDHKPEFIFYMLDKIVDKK